MDNLHSDLLEIVASKLYPKDAVRFRSVCKKWLSVTPEIRSHHASLPLLLCAETKKYSLYSPWLQRSFSVQIPGLPGPSSSVSILHTNKAGISLFFEYPDTVFAVSPFAVGGSTRFDLPKSNFNYATSSDGVSFATTSTGTVSAVLAILSISTEDVLLTSWRFGRNDWKHWEFHNEYPFQATKSNPVLLDGLFYCLGEDGRLAVCDPSKSLNSSWKVLANPVSATISEKLLELDPKDRYGYLVESDGDLYAVFTSMMMRDDVPVNVFKLNWSNMSWMETHNLDNNMIFVNPTHALMTRLPESESELESKSSWGNKIYHPMFRCEVEREATETRMSLSEDHVFFLTGPPLRNKDECADVVVRKSRRKLFPSFGCENEKGVQEEVRLHGCEEAPVCYSLQEKRIHPVSDFNGCRFYVRSTWVVPRSSSKGQHFEIEALGDESDEDDDDDENDQHDNGDDEGLEGDGGG